MGDLEERINAWHDQIANMTPENLEARRDVELVIAKLDDGQLRVAEVAPSGEVIVHDWVKKAIMLLFRLHGLEKSEAGPFEYLDKLELKYDYERRGVRVVPGVRARWSTRGRRWAAAPRLAPTCTWRVASVSAGSSSRRTPCPS